MDNFKFCSMCGKKINKVAKKCPYCDFNFNNSSFDSEPAKKKLREITGGAILSDYFLNALKSKRIDYDIGYKIQLEVSEEIDNGTIDENGVELRIDYLLNKYSGPKSSSDLNPAKKKLREITGGAFLSDSWIDYLLNKYSGPKSSSDLNPAKKKLREITGGAFLSDSFLNALKSKGFDESIGYKIQLEVSEEIDNGTIDENGVELRINQLLNKYSKPNFSNSISKDESSKSIRDVQHFDNFSVHIYDDECESDDVENNKGMDEECSGVYGDEYEIKYSTVEHNQIVSLNKKLDEYKSNELFTQKEIDDINENIEWQLQISKRSNIKSIMCEVLSIKFEFLRRFGKYSECNNELRQNIRKYPHYPYFWLDYAYLFLYLNKNLKAFECYKIALLFDHPPYDNFLEMLEYVYNCIDFDEVHKTGLLNDNLDLDLDMEKIKMIEKNDSSEYSLLDLVILTEESIKEVHEINRKIAKNMEDVINRELFEEVWRIEESAHFWEDEGIYLSSTEVNFEKVYSQIDRERFLDGLSESELDKTRLIDKKLMSEVYNNGSKFIEINEIFYRHILKTLDIDIPTWNY